MFQAGFFRLRITLVAKLISQIITFAKTCQILSCEYRREFSKNYENALIRGKGNKFHLVKNFVKAAFLALSRLESSRKLKSEIASTEEEISSETISLSKEP